MNIPKIIEEYIRNKSYTQDSIGMSSAGVYLFDDIVLKIQKNGPESENEALMLQWLSGKIPVPNTIEQTCENNCSYILMSKCQGKMACDTYYMSQPKRQIQLLADALHMLWSVDISDCPCKWPLQRRLELAEENVIHNRVDMDDAQPDTFGPNAFRDPEDLLYWLKENQPEQTQCLSHGDFCLPNIFVLDNLVTGMIDLGKSGISDPWQDVALCCRSLDNNYNGMYDGVSYAGYEKQMLFDAMGIQPDQDRIRYYILLDELF